MKKTFLLAAGLMAASSVVMAQSSIDTYDVCDADLNHVVSVADATAVVNRVLANTPGNEVVTAADLNALLTELNNNIVGLRKDVADVRRRVNYVMTKSGIEYPELDANGVVANGHEYVDLGLTTKVTVNGVEKVVPIYWATCNVGAEKPEDYGLYFAWGDVVGYTKDVSDGHSFDWANYVFEEEGYSDWKHINKYTFKDGQTLGMWYYNGTFVGDGKTVLEPEDDAATQNWKGSWRMPTYDELNELKSKCTWTWNATNKGYTVTGPNGKSIFLPAADYRYYSYLDYDGSYGYYWSSSLYTNNSINAYYLYFFSSSQGWNDNYRYYGLSVRPVCVSAE